MFSYLDIQFPTLDMPLHRAYEFSSTHATYEHEMVKIYFLNWEVPYEDISYGTPVIANIKGFSSERTFNGYVYYVKPDISPNKKYVELTLIGASNVLKQQSQGLWVDSTADMVVADVARKNGFSYVAEPHPRVYEQIAQGSMTDWELLATLAKQCGYSFKADNTTLIFQPLTQEFTDMREQAHYYALGGLDTKSTGIYSFKPTIGESIPYEDAQKTTVAIAGVNNVTSVDHTNTNQKSIKTTRKKSQKPVIDSYNTRVVAPSFEIAKYESNAADERNRYAYRGEVTIPGNPSLLPNTPVYLDGLGGSYSGYWTVLTVEHLVEEHMFTTTALVGTDSLGLSTKWTDNQEIDQPADKVKRIIKPGSKQVNKKGKTSLKKTGKIVKKGKVSPLLQSKNVSKSKKITAPSYQWKGAGGNLKPPAKAKTGMSSAVLGVLASQRG